ncbi:MAG: SDR family NAD(P)-dependent oxidoreductase, partial [Planctomycetales bacterium]|nr:SDR family NAD(P)-dependent oxidoreductase [Planctomycetales bacterium]
TDAGATKGLITDLAADGFTPNVLINCAGIREFAEPLEISPEHWQQMLSVNLSGTFFISQAVAKIWRDRGLGGVIVNTTSTSGIFASENRVGYVSAKHGVVGMTKQLALDLGPLGIRVNAVAPGVVQTPMTQTYFDDPQTE